MVTAAQFIASYPEFADALVAYPALVQSALDQAYALTPAISWPAELLDSGAQLRAAQTLALSPYGRNLGMTSKDGGTNYDARLTAFVTRIGGGGSFV